MPLTTPKLDDRSYADLLNEARTLIPSLYPEWTDHNPTDPGITLIELFAWLTEMLIFRADQVPDRHRLTFLRLLNGPDPDTSLIGRADMDATTRQRLLDLLYPPPRDAPPELFNTFWDNQRHPPHDLVEEAVRVTIVGLRWRERAVTCPDFETLALEASSAIARTRCLPRRNLDAGTEQARTANRPGHVSVIILPPTAPFTSILLFDGTYTDHTQEASSEGGTSFALNGAPEHVLYIGLTEPFGGIQFRLDVKGVNYDLKFEYFSPSGWTELTRAKHNLIDDTFGWTRDGLVRFALPPDWVATAVNDVTCHWVRISTGTTPDQVARASQIVCPLTQTAYDYLEPRRSLTTRHHVVEPFYAPVRATVLVARRADSRDAAVRDAVVQALNDFLDPLRPDGSGWPFGRDIYLSELYDLLESVPGVDHVPDIMLDSACETADPHCVVAAQQWHDNGDLIGLALEAHHLPRAEIDPARIVVAASYVPVRLTLRVALVANADQARVWRAIKALLKARFHPLRGDPDGKNLDGKRNWAITRGHIQEGDPRVRGFAVVIPLDALRSSVQQIPGVQNVADIDVHSDPSWVIYDALGNEIGVGSTAQELADVQIVIELAR